MLLNYKVKIHKKRKKHILNPRILKKKRFHYFIFYFINFMVFYKYLDFHGIYNSRVIN